jgi:DNA-binding XRE family transcriptional regulator
MAELNPLERRRRLAKMTQKDVAEAIGVARRQYGNIEKRVTGTNVLTGIKIARLFNTTVEELWGDQVE